MKKYIFGSIVLILLYILLVGSHYSTYASSGEKESIDLTINSDEFFETYNPQKELSNEANQITEPFINIILEIVNKALAFLQVFGGLLTIISVAIYGFRLFLNANPKLADDLGFNTNLRGDQIKNLQDFGRSLLIGSILLFASTTLVRFVFSVFSID